MSRPESNSGTHDAVVRLNGKQIKSSPETQSLPKARRKLRDYRKDLSRLDPAQARSTAKGLVEPELAKLLEKVWKGFVKQKEHLCDKYPRSGQASSRWKRPTEKGICVRIISGGEKSAGRI